MLLLLHSHLSWKRIHLPIFYLNWNWKIIYFPIFWIIFWKEKYFLTCGSASLPALNLLLPFYFSLSPFLDLKSWNVTMFLGILRIAKDCTELRVESHRWCYRKYKTAAEQRSQTWLNRKQWEVFLWVTGSDMGLAKHLFSLFSCMASYYKVSMNNFETMLNIVFHECRLIVTTHVWTCPFSHKDQVKSKAECMTISTNQQNAFNSLLRCRKFSKESPFYQSSLFYLPPPATAAWMPSQVILMLPASVLRCNLVGGVGPHKTDITRCKAS